MTLAIDGAVKPQLKQNNITIGPNKTQMMTNNLTVFQREIKLKGQR